jgi:hypothetical protein
MGTERTIAARMAEGLGRCKIRKYTDYHGEYMDCESLGIVFPSRRWGLSLAVDSFFKSIITSSSTYVYAVAVNESLTGRVNEDSFSSIKALEQLKNDINVRLLNPETDIYIRSNDRVREVVDAEYDMRRSDNSALNVRCMMNALLYHNLVEFKNSIAVGNRYMYNLKELQNGKTMHVEPVNKDETEGKHRLSNVFLDDDIFAEDKICRVI